MELQDRQLRSKKFDLRMTDQEKTMIKHAARLQQTTPTNFIRQQAVNAAQAVLRQHTQLDLTNDQWRILQVALADSPLLLASLQRQLTETELPEQVQAG